MSLALRARGWCCVWLSGGAALGVLLGVAGARAQELPEAQTQGELYRKVKVFDFDERPLGNWEDTPMYWRRLAGEGLPAYSRGHFDDDFGHNAPPSFVMDVQGGSVAYEYQHTDLAISPKSDYVIEGYIRAEGLEYARALITCHLLDSAGGRIPGSDRVCQPVGSVADGPADEPWQQVQITLPGEFPSAHTLRLQLWVLQSYVFEATDDEAVDPIIRQEVDARVWFDDITIIRMPRVRLWFSNPGGIVKPGHDESFHVEIHNATLAPLDAKLRVLDNAHQEQFLATFEFAPRATEELQIPVPALPAGMYTAEVQLRAEGRVLVQRAIRFAILPELFSRSARFHDFGIDLGRWPEADPGGAVELIGTLGCGAVKIGLPMIETPKDAREASHLRQMREMARHLALDEIESTGVLLAPSAGAQGTRTLPTYRVLLAETTSDDRLGPVFAHFGGHLTSWQLGHESSELREPGGWSPATIEQVREKLQRFVAVPQLVVPRSVLDAASARSLLEPESADADELPGVPQLVSQPLYAYSFWLPADLPARTLPWHLAFWIELNAARQGVPVELADAAHPMSRYWLSLEMNTSPLIALEDRIADLARRVVLASVVEPERIYVPAPFELVHGGGSGTWQPREEYIPLRTLLDALSGASATAAMTLPHDGVAVLFHHRSHDTLVLWTWAASAPEEPIELYVGPAATARELSGQRRPLDIDGPKARIPLGPMPLIIENVDAPLLLMQNSFKVEPAFIQLHEPDPRPVLALRNTYRSEIAGTITLYPPQEWHVEPNPIRMLLSPGEALAQTLYFSIPPRTIARERVLHVKVQMLRPDLVNLEFDVPLQIGLKDVTMKTTMQWEGNALVVEQTVQNLAPYPLSFTTFCQAPERARMEGVLLDVPPGDARTQIYHLPNARDLRDGTLWMGIDEIEGRRTLDQLVAVPG